MGINLVLEILAAACFFLAFAQPYFGERFSQFNLIALGLFLLTLGGWIIK